MTGEDQFPSEFCQDGFPQSCLETELFQDRNTESFAATVNRVVRLIAAETSEKYRPGANLRFGITFVNRSLWNCLLNARSCRESRFEIPIEMPCLSCDRYHRGRLSGHRWWMTFRSVVQSYLEKWWSRQTSMRFQ